MRLGLGLGVGGTSASSGFSGGHSYELPQLPGLCNWYRSDLGITLNGNNVTAWADQSGYGRHLVQATTTKQPPWSQDGGPKNLPYIGTFDRVDDFLRVTYAQVQPEHLFCVAMLTATDAAAGDTLDGATGNTRRLYVRTADSPSIFAGTAEVFDASEGAAFHRFNCEYNGASSGITIDDRARVGGNAGAASSGGLILGMFGDQVSNPGDCRIAEIIIYNRILAAAEVASVNAYLTSRYGI